MKLNDNQYEIFENGKKVKTIKGHNAFYEFVDEYNEQKYKDGYETVKEYGNYSVFVNAKKQHCVFFAYRQYLGIKDCKGNKIYEGDSLILPSGQSVSLIKQWSWNSDSGYVLRFFENDDKWSDIPFDDKNICKIYNISVSTKVFDKF